MALSIGAITIDTNDLERASAFWQEVTGYNLKSSDESGTFLGHPGGSGPDLYLQVVPERRRGKNRLHLDLVADDYDGEVARVRALGASEVRAFDQSGSRWTVLADTDGNQFCIAAAA
jgi:predicted enzyme related to lactoylglutathione lyase